MKDFNIIAAVSLNGVIGDSSVNSMPWHISADLKNFKSITQNGCVIMGRKTYDSIGRPLPNRKNIVITSNKAYAEKLISEEKVDNVYSSFEEAHQLAPSGFFAIGGREIYSSAFKFCPKKLFITIVNKNFLGDVNFTYPGNFFLNDRIEINGFVYKCFSRSNMMEENDLKFQFSQFERQ